jgi:hypothetical protein
VPPITAAGIDDEMSVSGEESDDEDLTDTESSASGYSSARCESFENAEYDGH